LLTQQLFFSTLCFKFKLQDEKNVLLEFTFKHWTHFDGLQLWSYADTTITANPIGHFNNSDELAKFINGDKQVKNSIYKIFTLVQTNEECVVCNTFVELSKFDNLTNLNIILFVSFFYDEEVTPGCNESMQLSLFIY
jgi:hypothetical protein